METVFPYSRTVGDARRSATWRRNLHHWRGRQFESVRLLREHASDTEARRQDAICELMDMANVPNTAQAHRRAYPKLWTQRIRRHLGDPPRPEALVRWRRRRSCKRVHKIGVLDLAMWASL